MKNGFVITAVVSLLVLGGMSFFLWDRTDPADEPLEFYCAMGLNKSMQRIIKEYETRYDVKITVNYAGSGALPAQIKLSGKADLYLAADVTYIEDERAKGNKGIDVRETFFLAQQRPVIAVHKGNPLGIKTLDDLLDKKVLLSLADPKVAAISKVVKKRLDDAAWDKLWESKRASHATVTAVAGVVAIEKDSAGIVWDVTANQNDMIDTVVIPEFDAKRNQITLAVLGSSLHPASALRFARFVSAHDEGLKMMKEDGYDVVAGDKWDPGIPEIVFYGGGLNQEAVKGTLAAFEKREGVKILTKFGGCGGLVGEMNAMGQDELPDMYFACDTSYLTTAKLDYAETAFQFQKLVSSTDMVIVTPPNRDDIRTIPDMAKSGVKVGLCDAEKSALGALSRKLINSFGVLNQVNENAKDFPATAPQLVAKVATGALDAAVVYRANATNAANSGKLKIIPILDDQGNPHPLAVAHQPIAINLGSDNYRLCQRLVEAILSDDSKKNFLRLGFSWEGKTPTK